MTLPPRSLDEVMQEWTQQRLHREQLTAEWERYKADQRRAACELVRCRGCARCYDPVADTTLE